MNNCGIRLAAEYFFDGIGGIIYDMIWLWVFGGIDFWVGLAGSLR
jgi:hypothetical protein